VGPMRYSLLITLGVFGLVEGKPVIPASALQAATTTESPCDACKAIVEDGKSRFVAKHAAASSSDTAKLAAFKTSYYSAFIEDCAAHPALGASNCVQSAFGDALAVVPEQRDQLPSVRDAQLVECLQLVGRGRVRRPDATAGRRGRRVDGREPPSL